MKTTGLCCLVLSLLIVIPGFGNNAEDANKLDESLLHATIGGAIDQAEILLAQGADINVTDGRGQTPLHLAVREGHLALAKLLLAKGADINAQDKFGWTALHFAANRGEQDMANLLIASGADVKAKSGVIIAEGEADEGWTPLHVACTIDRTAVVGLLLAHGADVKAKTRNGCTALALAQEREFDEIVDLLRKHGAGEEPVKK